MSGDSSTKEFDENLLLRWEIITKLIPVFGADQTEGLLVTARKLVEFVQTGK